MPKLLPVNLSGGSGTRLWPVSRRMYPKQLLPLVGDLTMLQDTVRRARGLPDLTSDCVVICNETHRFLVAEQLREIEQAARIVLEPDGRNTAPAAGLAACLAAESDPDTLLLVLPSDHVIADNAAFHAAVVNGIRSASDGQLVTFGIVPTSPETGYGYINAVPDKSNVVPVLAFVEKPDQDTAIRYVDGGRHFWNGGMFLFSASAFLRELREFAPEIHDACERSVALRVKGDDFVRPDKASFLNCPSDSIDYAVMEKSSNVAMVPLNAGWSDVGSWSALHDVHEKDGDLNVTKGDVITHDCRDTYIQAESRLVTAVGVENLVIVETKDSTLVVSKDRSQSVKELVDKLVADERVETDTHRQVFRPWGSYDSLESQDGFQVKRLIVNPGAVLSLQKHAHRAEHWVVVRGRADITRNDEVFELGVNESTFIAIGDVHRIANPYDEPVHIIEVQCGDYLGEDDIVRLEDNYGREGTTT